MRLSCFIWVGPKWVLSVLTWERQREVRHRQREGDTNADAEVGIMSPCARQYEAHLGDTETGKGQEGFSLRTSGESIVLLTPWIGISGLQNCERINAASFFFFFFATKFVAIYFNNGVAVQLLSHVWLLATPWTAAMPGFPVLHYLPEFV